MSDSGVTDGIGKMSVGGDSNRVLREVTAASVNKPVKDNETALRAKEHGWAKPVEFDYKKYVDDKVNEAMNGEGTATTGADKTGGAAARADAAGGAVNYTSDIPDWASNAAKYEWKQEYGDVAPRHKELEEQLFRNEFQPVVGEQLSV
jgi:ATP-dependent RNA helicase DDX3X